MRHILTIAELVESFGFNDTVNSTEYNLTTQLSMVVEALKSDPQSDLTMCDLDTDLFYPSRMAKAIGILCGLVAMHEIAQHEREWVDG